MREGMYVCLREKLFQEFCWFPKGKYTRYAAFPTGRGRKEKNFIVSFFPQRISRSNIDFELYWKLNKEIVNRKMTRSRSGLSQMWIIYLVRFIEEKREKKKDRFLRETLSRVMLKRLKQTENW